MSALSLPPTAPTAPTASTAAARRARPRPAPAAPASRRPDLRLVQAPPRPALAPTGPLQAWRRRIGALLVLVALLALGVQVVAGGPTAAPEVVPASAATVVVEPGQTLWDVANEHAPADTSPGAYVRELAELNGISNGALDAWQVLRLPAG